MDSKLQISFLGAGAIGTSLGNIIAEKNQYQITLYSIEKEVVEIINRKGVNVKYFPMFQLHHTLKATTDHSLLSKTEVLFLAIPSVVLVDFLIKIKPFIQQNAILINLAKGFGKENKTITEDIESNFPNRVGSLKGPTFARELINRLPSTFTLGYRDHSIVPVIQEIFRNTTVFLDYSEDIKGVEILSILKNIYAIVIGIVDAHFNSPNLRSLVLTKSFSEMRDILTLMGGKQETMFKSCGIGDFTHTALNDLSRNRTLGLLIGKGFFTEHVSHELVLEGRNAVNILYQELNFNESNKDRFPILSELYSILHNLHPVSNFINSILQHG